MFDPRPLYCSSLTTVVVGTYVYINFVDFSSAYCGTNQVCSDFQLVKQIEDSYEAKSEKMILYLKKVRELLKKFIRVQARHILRMENSWVDALAKLATSSQEDLDVRVPVEHLMEPLIDVNSDEVLPVMIVPSWMDPIC